jgi:hypothetical protein
VPRRSGVKASGKWVVIGGDGLWIPSRARASLIALGGWLSRTWYSRKSPHPDAWSHIARHLLSNRRRKDLAEGPSQRLFCGLLALHHVVISGGGDLARPGRGLGSPSQTLGLGRRGLREGVVRCFGLLDADETSLCDVRIGHGGQRGALVESGPGPQRVARGYSCT